MIGFMRHLQGFIGITCVIRQILASQDLIVDMIFEWLEFLSKFRPKKNHKKPKNTENTEKKPKTTANFKFGTGFSIFVFLGLASSLKKSRKWL